MTVLSSIADKFINFPAIPAGRHIFICSKFLNLNNRFHPLFLHNDITSSNNAYLKVLCTKFKAEF